VSSIATDLLGDSPSQTHRRPMLPPVVRGLIWALIAFLVFNTLISEVLDRMPYHPFVTRASVTVGWVAAVCAWLLGVGVWEGVVKPSFGFPTLWETPTDWRKYFMYSTDHRVIGLQYIFSSIGGFMIAGFAAMLMRLELMNQNLWVFSNPGAYLSTVGIHGTVMMFSVGTVGLVGGFGNYLIPLMVGSNKSAFPRMSGISQWLVPAGIATVVLSPVLGQWTTGWRGYEPLASQDPAGIVFYYLGVFALTTSSLMVAINLTATILFKRAPGLTWNRIPMFAWGMLTVSLLNLIWLPEIQMAFLLGLLGAVIPFPFFTQVGSPLTYLEVFWLFGHPEVYIVVVPAFALWQEILPVMGQKSLFARQWGIIGLVFVMILSGMVWAHHMFTNMSNSQMLPFSFFTEIISIPTGFAYLVVIGTLWKARLRLTTPTLLILMSMFNFLIGGVTGVLLADPVVNLQVHDTFFVVAHFHYTIIGAMIFSWFAAFYYWLPKFTGRMYSERWGKVLSVWIFIAFNVAFLQMFLLGLHGMNRWVPVYPAYLQPMNFQVSLFAILLGIGFVLHFLHIAWMWWHGPRVEENPWRSKTLEWQTASPPGEENFTTIPTVVRGFYDYSDDRSAVAVDVHSDAPKGAR